MISIIKDYDGSKIYRIYIANHPIIGIYQLNNFWRSDISRLPYACTRIFASKNSKRTIRAVISYAFKMTVKK